MQFVPRKLFADSWRHLFPRSPKRVVVIGGGPCGLYCVDRLRHHFQVTLIDVKDFFEYTPGMCRALVDPAQHSKLTFEYRETLERQMGVQFVLGQASQISATSEKSNTGGGSVQVASAGAKPRRLHFDYCVVAVGMGNGMWKPRIGSDSEGPGWSTGKRLQDPHTRKVQVAERAAARMELTLDARRAAFRNLRERLHTAPGAVVVGAGLVGVELAAELAHFAPHLKVRLVDASPVVLPQLGESARQYAHSKLVESGVKLLLGKPFVKEMVYEDYLILWCVGPSSRIAGLFEDQSVLTDLGALQVNSQMQVLSLSNSGEIEPFCRGRVFSVGDVARVQKVPTTQTIFHGEEMGSVACHNIEAACDVGFGLSLSDAKYREIETPPVLTCTSLGPRDGVFSTQSELIASGGVAALQKQLIEDTKMGHYRGDLLSSLLWLPVH